MLLLLVSCTLKNPRLLKFVVLLLKQLLFSDVVIKSDFYPEATRSRVQNGIQLQNLLEDAIL